MAALLLSMEDAAAHLGLGRTTVYALVRSGALSPVRVGRRTLLPEAELVAYVGRLRDGSAA